MDEAGGVSGGFWVEGESDEKMCPLRDVSPLTNPFGPGTFLTDIAAAFNGVEAQPQTGDGEKTKGGAAAAAIEARLMRLREADRGGEAVPAGAVQQKMETLEGSMKGEELEQLKDLQAQVGAVWGTCEGLVGWGEREELESSGSISRRAWGGWGVLGRCFVNESDRLFRRTARPPSLVSWAGHTAEAPSFTRWPRSLPGTFSPALQRPTPCPPPFLSLYSSRRWLLSWVALATTSPSGWARSLPPRPWP